MDEKVVKIIFAEDGREKVLKGYIIKEDEHSYTVKGLLIGNIVIIGKRNLIKMTYVGDFQ